MPQVFRRRTPLSDALPTPAVEPTDADDSIVLDDLVRTGEASRLRRRGAMRLDHAFINQFISTRNPDVQQTQQEGAPADTGSHSSQTPAVVLVGSAEWEPTQLDPDPEQENNEDEYRTWGGGWGARSGERVFGGDDEGGVAVNGDERMMEESDKEEYEYEYTLYCGGEEEVDPQLLLNGHPFVPSILPLYPSDRTSASSLPPPPPRTNGCGTVVHLHAAPRRRLGVWMAKKAAEEAVVPMDPCYFDQAAVAKILRSACGCVREGIGCGVCGNPLGTRYKPCQAASEGLFSSMSSAPRTPRPDTPRYPLPRQSSVSSGRSVASSFYMYTFFGSAVSSAPPRCLPAPKPQPRSVAEAANVPSGGLFDRILTASPAVMSDAGGRVRAYNNRQPERIDTSARPDDLEQDWSGFDPDGELLPTMPNSPDKTATDELMLFPER